MPSYRVGAPLPTGGRSTASTSESATRQRCRINISGPTIGEICSHRIDWAVQVFLKFDSQFAIWRPLFRVAARFCPSRYQVVSKVGTRLWRLAEYASSLTRVPCCIFLIQLIAVHVARHIIHSKQPFDERVSEFVTKLSP